MISVHHATLFKADTVYEVSLPSEVCSGDIYDVYLEKVGIDDVRGLVQKAYNRPVQEDVQVLVVRTDFITLEAQNALLKILEEPPRSTRFVFVISESFILLPTLTSRFEERSLEKREGKVDLNDVFDHFFQSEYKDRMVAIETAHKKKNTVWQQSLKQGLITYLRRADIVDGSLKELEYVARTLLTRGASNKMLLEHLALVLPTRS